MLRTDNSGEFDIEEHGTRLMIVQELLLEAKPGGSSRDAVAGVDDVKKVCGDGVVKPGDDDTVHASPCRVREKRSVAEDMVLQGKAAEDEQDVAAPLREVGSLEVYGVGKQVSNVLDGGGLAVEPGDGRCVGGVGVVVVVVVLEIIIPQGGVVVAVAESRTKASARSLSRASPVVRTRSLVAAADLRRPATSWSC